MRLYWIALLMAVILSGITEATTTVYTSRSQWEQAVGYYDEETFTDATLNPNISVDAGNPPHGYVDVAGQEGYGEGVWWDRVSPGQSGDFSIWFFSSPVTGFGGDWNLAGPGGEGTGIQLYLDGVPVSNQIPNTMADGFWGIVSTIPFDAILIEAGTFEGNAETYVLDNMVYNCGIAVFTKSDNVETCASPQETIEYTICFDNAFGQAIQDPFIIDWLPDGVDYDFLISISPLIVDENYNIEEHYYRWELEDIDPNDASCLNLEVTVNYNALPGGYLHNVAELWGTIMVASDPNDPNTLTPVTRLIDRAIKDTPVCCWQDSPEVLYVDKNATSGANNGLDWQNAFLDLQDALDYARPAVCGEVESIYVAQETYSPGEDEEDTFELPENVSVYGGFPTGGCEFSLRNPKKYETILSGKIDDTHRNNQIVTMGNNTLLDGFTVTDCGLDLESAGVYASSVDFTVNNSVIVNNLGYGAFIENANATFKWCTFRNNEQDGIRHTGEGKSLVLENVWVRQSGQYGVYTINSVPIIINSILSESDMSLDGRAGLLMVNPPQRPCLLNVTCAHNFTEGIALAGANLPEIYNSIVYHNGGPALAGFTADQAASYSCIEDCNSVNNNISTDPMFAYFDPNNVRIMEDSPCHDSGLTVQEHYSQFDMDNRDRVLGTAVDRGAYEIECEDTSNSYDRNADGLVNLVEFNAFSKAWLSHDPNDPMWIADPNLAEPNLTPAWNPVCNFNTTGDSAYAIDLADLMDWVEEAPWLWKACWVTEESLSEMLAGGDNMLMGDEEVILFSEIMASSEPVVEEKSVQEQILDLASAIVFLERIWLEEPDIQAEISAEGWQKFMDAVYQNLLELQTQDVPIE